MKTQRKYFATQTEALGYLRQLKASNWKILVDPLSSRFPELAAFETIAVEVSSDHKNSTKPLANQPTKLAS